MKPPRYNTYILKIDLVALLDNTIKQILRTIT